MKNKDWIGLVVGLLVWGYVLQGIYETSKPGHIFWRAFQPENRDALISIGVVIGVALATAAVLFVLASVVSKKFSKKV